jgi:hypothetical protein
MVLCMIFAIVFAIPTFATSLAGLSAITIGSDDDAASHTCSFNHITVVCVAMDVITRRPFLCALPSLALRLAGGY